MQPRMKRACKSIKTLSSPSLAKVNKTRRLILPLRMKSLVSPARYFLFSSVHSHKSSHDETSRFILHTAAGIARAQLAAVQAAM